MFDANPSPNPARSTESISTDVVVAVSTVKDVEPTDLPPLYGTIDPEALDRFFSKRGANAESDARAVAFAFAGCEIVVDGADGITVTPTETSDESRIEA